MALTVTGMGGLSLLAGLLLLGYMAGSYDLGVVLQSGQRVRTQTLYPAAVCLILIGAFNGQFDVANARYFTAVAATGVILSAVYMLWMFQRVNYGPVTNPKNRGLRDLSVREWLVIGPVCAMAIFMGVFPGVFLRPMEPAVKRTVESVVGSGRPANTRVDPVPPKKAVVVAEVR